MDINFTKMQGLGNDMIVMDNLDLGLELSSVQVSKMCDRRFGIGADGLILIEKSENADFFMNYYNSDGSIGEVCGNGIRCAVRFLVERGFDAEAMRVETRAGVKDIRMIDGMFAVNMGKPVFESEDFPADRIELEGFELNFVSMGNPHAVAVFDDVEKVNLKEIGPKIEVDSHFPNKINFEIVQQIDEKTLKMRVWERGSGITLACGTGACAVYVVCKNLGMADGKVEVRLPGGSLWIEENSKEEIVMTGPAELSFEGTYFN